MYKGGESRWFRTALVGMVCCAASLAAASHGAYAYNAGTSVVVAGIDAASRLNVRAGPGTTHAVVTTLEAGRDGLTVEECTGAADWCRIAADGRRLGWVAARYLVEGSADVPVRPDPDFNEAARLTRVTGVTVNPDGLTTVPELPPYLLGEWDVDRVACGKEQSESRITVLKNGLTIGAATARFKNAVFRDDGYDLTTLLMQDEDVPDAVPQRALYRLEPDSTGLVLSGDVLIAQRRRRCEN